jgi:hypothetical protein
MIELILSLPDFLGGFVMMFFCTATGLTAYLLSSKFIVKYQTSDLKDPGGGLFRVVGMLVSLMLSLSFGQVVVEWRNIQNAIKGEVVAITDVSTELQQLQTVQAKKLHSLLVKYTEAVIYDDWPELAHDRLGKLTKRQLLELLDEAHKIEPESSTQKMIKSDILKEIDKIADYRLARLNNALAEPSIYTAITFIGFLATMLCFGVYRPQIPLVFLASVYTSLVGAVLYLILTLSDPFQGSISMNTILFERLAEHLQTIDMTH